jgi:hypothetical protein
MREMNWIKQYLWIGVLGSVLLFVSWVFQNVFSQEYQQQVGDMKHTQQAVDIAQLRMELWQSVFLKEKKSGPGEKLSL